MLFSKAQEPNDCKQSMDALVDLSDTFLAMMCRIIVILNLREEKILRNETQEMDQMYHFQNQN